MQPRWSLSARSPRIRTTGPESTELAGRGRVAQNRANHFQRDSGGQGGGRAAQYAEGFQSAFPRRRRALIDLGWWSTQPTAPVGWVIHPPFAANPTKRVGPAAIERGLVPVTGETTPVRMHMLNTGEVAVAQVATPDGRVGY